MSKPLIIIDSQFLCYQTYYANKKMPESDSLEIFVLNFLGRVIYFSKQIKSKNIVFAWDSVKSYRKDLLPEYKQARKERLTEQEKRERHILYKRIDFLREKVIPKLGFKNSFLQEGLEADDIIADLVYRYKKDHQIYIIATDNDLYQLLDENVSVVLPNIKNSFFRIYSTESFKMQHKIDPKFWWKVKAIAGCVSDNVPGIRGIGPVNAIKWLKKEIDVNSKKGQLILNNLEIAEKNEQFVRLPHTKTEKCLLQEDDLSSKKFKWVCEKLGVWDMVKADTFTGWTLFFSDSENQIKERLNK